MGSRFRAGVSQTELSFTPLMQHEGEGTIEAYFQRVDADFAVSLHAVAPGKRAVPPLSIDRYVRDGTEVCSEMEATDVSLSRDSRVCSAVARSGSSQEFRTQASSGEAPTATAAIDSRGTSNQAPRV
jgi:hypothetical protein